MNKILIIIYIFSNLIFSQKSFLDISGMRLKLGMSKEAFNNEIISENFSIDNRDPKIGSLIEKDNKIYGRVYFDHKNRVCQIVKEWILKSEDMSAFEILSTIYTIMQNGMDNNKLKQALVQLAEINEPEVKVKNIVITIGESWSISLYTYLHDGNRNSYSISETIGKLPVSMLKKYDQ
jgi:hypothetical protein